VNPQLEWSRWVAWVGDDPTTPNIFKDIVGMLYTRQVWDGFRIVYERAPAEAHADSTFQSWITQNYVRAQGLGVRRQVDVRSDVISIGRLIDRVARFPEVLSRDHLFDRTSQWSTREESDATFSRVVGAGDFIDPAIPATDLDDLRVGTARVRKMVTKEFAHYDTNHGRFSEGVTFGDLHAAIDVVVQMAVKYRRMIHGADMHPEVAMTHWPRIFRVAWISDDEHDRQVADEIGDYNRRRLDGTAD
jgi:hypothetical protein